MSPCLTFTSSQLSSPRSNSKRHITLCGLSIFGETCADQIILDEHLAGSSIAHVGIIGIHDIAHVVILPPSCVFCSAFGLASSSRCVGASIAPPTIQTALEQIDLMGPSIDDSTMCDLRKGIPSTQWISTPTHGKCTVDQLRLKNVPFQHMQHCHLFVIWGFVMLLQKFGAAWEPHGDMKSFSPGLQERRNITIKSHHVEFEICKLGKMQIVI